MTKSLLIAGGGIAGLAAGLAARRAGWQAQVFERAREFSEVGAGVQLGPNVTRILQAWGLTPALAQVAAFPAALHARDLHTGEVLATLPLHNAPATYGAPYVTIHRADLHGLLLQAATTHGVTVDEDAWVQRISQTPDATVLDVLHNGQPQQHTSAAAVAADGVWSPLRQQLLGDGAPTFTGHTAYRALVAQKDLPLRLRSADITVWMGPNVHVVSYPVRGGEWLNVVCLVQGRLHPANADHGQALQTWESPQTAAQTLAELAQALEHARGHACPAVTDLVAACPPWRCWPLWGRPAMHGPHEQVQARVALVGDAAHPMLPYLAQGAGMAIEDAAVLGLHLGAANAHTLPQHLQQFAHARWQRNARVQKRAVRNGYIFHARGLLQIGRDLGLRMMGAKLMDLPWLYGDRLT